jgi:hypothetical protein
MLLRCCLCRNLNLRDATNAKDYNGREFEPKGYIMEAPQILRDAEEWLATVNINTSGHDANCHKRHSSCMVQRLANECRNLLAKTASVEATKAKPKTTKRSTRSG